MAGSSANQSLALTVHFYFQNKPVSGFPTTTKRASTAGLEFDTPAGMESGMKVEQEHIANNDPSQVSRNYLVYNKSTTYYNFNPYILCTVLQLKLTNFHSDT